MKIAILDKCTVTNGDICFDELDALGDVTYYDILNREQILAALCDKDAVICNKAIIDREVMDKCPNLKYIGLFATGYNNIDLQAADEKGIYVANVPDYSTASVAQHTFALILQLANKTSQYIDLVNRGEWIKSTTFSYFPLTITELCGKTLGIFGYGAIGKAVAKIADAMGMRVIICTRTKPESCSYEIVDKEALFSQSDVVTIHCPLNEQTQNLVCKQTLSLMKPSAFLINTSRGGVVCEQDLADALNNKMIAGAAVDVLSTEPMKEDNPLYRIENCLITPHVAWATPEARKRLVTIAANGYKAFECGKPINIVNHPVK